MSQAVDITPKQDGGVLKEIINEGVGDEKAPNGCKVKVHYTGTLLDGTKFDSSRDRDDLFEFDLGKGQVIKAWDIGVASMKKGERAMLTCASDYAYGAAGSPPNIPPDSVLKFDVEVFEWQGEDLSPNKDASIQKFQITAGDGYSSPKDEGLVQVQLEGTYNNAVFDSRTVSFNLGEGSDTNIVEGIEIALESFKKGEKSKLLIKSRYAFGENGNSEFNIPPNATVEYVVTLKTFENVKGIWSLDAVERLEQAKLFKNKGNDYFKAEKYKLAIKFYKKIFTCLEADKDLKDDATQERVNVQLSGNLNLSLCYLKLNEYFDARNAATAAIALDPKNEKAYFRRGQALIGVSEPKLALQDFDEVLKLEPNNQAAKAQQSICKKSILDLLKKEKQIYANMFDKFAKTDIQKEEDEKKKLPDVMSSLGEWGKEDRHREPSEFEKENPNILLLNGSGEFKDM